MPRFLSETPLPFTSGVLPGFFRKFQIFKHWTSFKYSLKSSFRISFKNLCRYIDKFSFWNSATVFFINYFKEKNLFRKSFRIFFRDCYRISTGSFKDFFHELFRWFHLKIFQRFLWKFVQLFIKKTSHRFSQELLYRLKIHRGM